MDTSAFVETRRIGAATVTAISDGTFPFAPQLIAPEASWRHEIPEANERGEILLGHTMVCIQLDDATILVDAGLDDLSPESEWQLPRVHRTPGVQAGLAAIGIQPEDVTHVIITHAHGDHFAGATVVRDGRRVARYPRARYLIGRADWEGNPYRERPDSLQAIHFGALGRLGLLDLVDGDLEVVPGVTMIAAPGESPGHSIVRLRSEGATFYAVGDLFHHPCEVAHTDWVSPGRERSAMQASRERLIAEAVPSDATVIFTHERFPPWGHIVRVDGGSLWESERSS